MCDAYYGHKVVFRFAFACGYTKKKGPMLEKFAYQYAGLGAKQRCEEHGDPEVKRTVRKVSGPHGNIELGFWKRQDYSWIWLTWTPATGSVDLWDGVDPDDLQGSLRYEAEVRRLGQI